MVGEAAGTARRTASSGLEFSPRSQVEHLEQEISESAGTHCPASRGSHVLNHLVGRMSLVCCFREVLNLGHRYRAGETEPNTRPHLRNTLPSHNLAALSDSSAGVKSPDDSPTGVRPLRSSRRTLRNASSIEDSSLSLL